MKVWNIPHNMVNIVPSSATMQIIEGKHSNSCHGLQHLYSFRGLQQSLAQLENLALDLQIRSSQWHNTKPPSIID
jgi:hypothetical protein